MIFYQYFIQQTWSGIFQPGKNIIDLNKLSYADFRSIFYTNKLGQNFIRQRTSIIWILKNIIDLKKGYFDDFISIFYTTNLINK